jgi:hypothetical protein
MESDVSTTKSSCESFIVALATVIEKVDAIWNEIFR